MLYSPSRVFLVDLVVFDILQGKLFLFTSFPRIGKPCITAWFGLQIRAFVLSWDGMKPSTPHVQHVCRTAARHFKERCYDYL
jgi:hypothetical protein